MNEDFAPLKQWCLQVRFLDGVESALFTSRQEALEHAQALWKDYDGLIIVDLFDPWGRKETLHGSPFPIRNGTN